MRLAPDEVDHLLRVESELVGDDVGKWFFAAQELELSAQDSSQQVFVSRCVAARVVQCFEAVREGVVAQVVEQGTQQTDFDVGGGEALAHGFVAK